MSSVPFNTGLHKFWKRAVVREAITVVGLHNPCDVVWQKKEVRRAFLLLRSGSYWVKLAHVWLSRNAVSSANTCKRSLSSVSGTKQQHCKTPKRH